MIEPLSGTKNHTFSLKPSRRWRRAAGWSSWTPLIHAVFRNAVETIATLLPFGGEQKLVARGRTRKVRPGNRGSSLATEQNPPPHTHTWEGGHVRTLVHTLVHKYTTSYTGPRCRYDTSLKIRIKPGYVILPNVRFFLDK